VAGRQVGGIGVPRHRASSKKSTIAMMAPRIPPSLPVPVLVLFASFHPSLTGVCRGGVPSLQQEVVEVRYRSRRHC
jgi:hypothetical protein